jgi:gamma-glutamylcyclotransferase (GGCT)/AIG2-like uncharacterized protein YtfP
MAVARDAATRGGNPAGAPQKPRQRPLRTRVFVYGSLLTGESNHRFVARSTLVGEARTQDIFSLYDLGAYPALVAGGRHAVIGEVYEVDEATLAELDRLEGHPRVYERTPITLADSSHVVTYLMQRSRVDGCSQIESGSWRTRQAERAGSAR